MAEVDLFDQVYREMLSKMENLKHRKPNTNSLFLNEYDKLQRLNSNSSAATLVCANLYTQGVLKLTRPQYEHLKTVFIKDIIEGKAVLAFTEVSCNMRGIRCFFEIDYRSSIRFPTEEEMTRHAKMAFNLVRECCCSSSSSSASPLVMYVAKCDRKLKFFKKKKEAVHSNDDGNSTNEDQQQQQFTEKKSQDEKTQEEVSYLGVSKAKLALGLHIVFPFILLHTSELRQLALTLDIRITADDPFFSGSVDASSVHREDATLRPLYTYRLEDCHGCVKQRKKSSSISKKSSSSTDNAFLRALHEWSGEACNKYKMREEEEGYDSDSDPLFLRKPLSKHLECKEGCFTGYKYANPSIYRPWFCLSNKRAISQGENKHHDNNNDLIETFYFDEQPESISHWILSMSIIPPEGMPFTSYNAAADSPAVTDPFIRPGVVSVFKSEVKYNRKTKNASDYELIPEQHTRIYQLVTELIQNFGTRHFYSDLVAQRVYFNKHLSILTVNVKGKSFKKCQILDNEHADNRIFFRIKLKCNRNTITQDCFDKVCKDIFRQWQNQKKKKKSKLNSKQSSESSVDCMKLSAKQKLILETSICFSIPLKAAKELKKLLGLSNHNVEDMFTFDQQDVFVSKRQKLNDLLKQKKQQLSSNNKDDFEGFLSLSQDEQMAKCLSVLKSLANELHAS